MGNNAVERNKLKLFFCLFVIILPSIIMIIEEMGHLNLGKYLLFIIILPLLLSFMLILSTSYKLWIKLLFFVCCIVFVVFELFITGLILFSIGGFSPDMFTTSEQAERLKLQKDQEVIHPEEMEKPQK